MSNKKSILSLEYIIVLVILGIVLILVLAAFLGPKIGLFNYFSKFVSSARSLLPGKEGIQINEIKTSQKFDEFFDKFRATFESVVGPEEKCLVKYEKIGTFEGFKVVLDNVGKDLTLRKQNKDGQILDQKEIKDINFCQINSEVFYSNHIGGEHCKTDCEEYIKDKTSVTITADEFDGQFGLEDGGLLYKPKNNLVCFIPTHKTGVTLKFWEIFTRWGCDASKTTLDNDCIEKIEKNIKLCSAK